MKVIKEPSFLTKFGKAHNLEFDKKFGYYIGNAYTDSKGETLKTYMYYNNKIYMLKYFDGCFNPFLVMVDHKGFGIINEGATTTHVVKANTPRLQQYYKNIYGSKFEMM